MDPARSAILWRALVQARTKIWIKYENMIYNKKFQNIYNYTINKNESN